MITIHETYPGDAYFDMFKNGINELYKGDYCQDKISTGICLQNLAVSFVAISEHKFCGRASLYFNPLLKYKDESACTIGNYECVQDDEISSSLIHAVLQAAKKSGMKFIVGPMNGSTWEQYRFIGSEKENLFFSEQCHHQYYNDQFLQSGFTVIKDYYSSIDNDPTFDHEKVLETEAFFKSEGVTFREINMENFNIELENIYQLTKTAFAKNFLYTDIDKSYFVEKYLALKPIIDPSFVILAHDIQGALIGYFLCFPDLYNKNEKVLIVKTLARHPDERWKGLGHVIGNMIYKKAASQNYTKMIHAFIPENGSSTNLSKNFSGFPFRKYALYGRTI